MRTETIKWLDCEGRGLSGEWHHSAARLDWATELEAALRTAKAYTKAVGCRSDDTPRKAINAERCLEYALEAERRRRAKAAPMSADLASPESSAGARGSALPSNNNGASTKESAVGSGRRLLTNNILFGKEIIGAADGDIWFVEVEKKVADELIVGHHYSHKATSNSFCSVLINGGKGAIQLGYGIRPKLKGALADLCQDGTWCEFDRMWLHDDLPKFSESRVIGLLFFYIKHRFPKLKFVITYADESAGNSGTIYRATNAVEIEGKEVDFYLLANGERLHPVTAWHRHGTRTFAKLAEIYPGIIRIRGDNVQGDASKEKLDSLRGKRQRKYIYALDKKSKKRLAIAMVGWAAGAGVRGKRAATKRKGHNVRISDDAT